MNANKIKNLRRKRARERKRRRMIISISLFLIIIFTLISKISSHIENKKNANFKISPTTMWYFNNALNFNKKLPKFSMDSPIVDVLEKADRLKDYILVKNSNHLALASNYAYDTKTIRNYITRNNYNGDEKIVFLTFDDGPNNKITPQILDTLKANNVHATFFVVGKNISEKHYAVLKRTLNEGNSIATHSYTHDYKLLYPERNANKDVIYNEVLRTNEKLENVFGKNFKSNVFRYPGGHMSWNKLGESDNTLSNAGIEWIDWNTLIGDAEKKSVRPTNAQGHVDYVNYSLNKNANRKIAVVLAHDAENKQLTADSLQSVIDYFKNHGYKFGVLK